MPNCRRRLQALFNPKPSISGQALTLISSLSLQPTISPAACVLEWVYGKPMAVARVFRHQPPPPEETHMPLRERRSGAAGDSRRASGCRFRSN